MGLVGDSSGSQDLQPTRDGGNETAILCKEEGT